MLKRETFRDRQERILGYVEHQSDKSQQAMNGDFTIIAYYDKRKDETQDPNRLRLNPGNTLVDMIVRNTKEWTVT